ncbi:YiiX family permuted papain-like enzyme [Mucilaginibacter calamicampi]|uniref:YiiX family permuted papain-like enzyme n=1 Tax=Mucilaginibacter calamicampi TaxID=1302352 RepID=A0ABW2YVH4_9SPHI
MKKIIFSVMLLCVLGLAGYELAFSSAAPKVYRFVNYDELQDGDIIFQTSSSPLSVAIQLATHSKYSHCGIIFKEKGAWYVYEAVQPVSITPLEQWIAHGDGGKFVIKRLANAKQTLTLSAINKMKQAGKQFMGKDYDGTFEWNDDRIYCSELVWKIYKTGAGIEVGKLKKLKDFDLSSQAVKTKLKEHYGNKIPLEEPVISPVAVFDSPLLVTVRSN